MRTLTLKQARKKLGLPETAEEKTRKLLKRLSLRELKYLAKKHRIKVRGRIYEDWSQKPDWRPPSVSLLVLWLKN